MAGATSYAAASDVSAYLPTATLGTETAYWTIALSNASRGIDRYCGRYFYAAGTGTKYFDGDGSDELYIRSHDFYTLTALKIALNENNDPATSGAWYTITGDGVTPPTNFFVEPANQVEIGSVTDNTLKRPYYRIALPSTPIPTSTGVDWLSVFTKGKRTVAVTASWGWPAIPDEIKDLTIKIVIRMWRAKEAGQMNNVPPAMFGEVMIARYLDPGDLEVLQHYRRATTF